MRNLLKKKATKVEKEAVEEKKEVASVCSNCENSGLSCSVCKLGRDDVV